MVKAFKLTKENFIEKQLAEQKGGLYKYYEYKEEAENKILVVRFYAHAVAVDYYLGRIDMEDSENAEGTHYEDGDAWDKALAIANKFFVQYEFKGPQE